MLSFHPGIVKALVRRHLHLSKYRDCEPEVYRSDFARRALPVPRGVRRQPSTGSVIGEWLLPKHAEEGKVILYLHGGAYCFGSVETHRELAGQLAKLSRRKVFLLDYRLAPEHPFPAAHDDAMEAFGWLVNEGYRPEDIAVVGDSAGGNLALSLSLGLRDRGSALPSRLVLLSPWTDLTCNAPVNHRHLRRDPMVDLEFAKKAAAQYAEKADPRHPLISPMFADLQGLPPMLIQVGSHEALRDEVLLFAAKARGANVPVELHVGKGMFHVWQAFSSVLAEARRANRQIANYLELELQARYSKPSKVRAS